MPGGIDTAMGTLTVPIWAAGAVCAMFVVAIALAIGRAGAVAFIATLFRVAVVLVAAYAGYVYMQSQSAQEKARVVQDHAAERRALEERSAALMTGTVAPGSALSCLDELAGEAVGTACEKAVFASPEAVAAAVSYVTLKLALLADGTRYAQRGDAGFAAELVPLRTSLELDRFGIVAQVLAQREACTVERCDALSRLSDSSHVLANLGAHTFDDHVTKYIASWNSPARAAPAESPAIAAVDLSGRPTPAPTSVSPRYDFPSAQSIPPVNIMAPEPVAPRPLATPGAAVTPASDAQPITPVPPRRPPQVRAAPANPPASRPAAARAEPQPPPSPAAGDTPGLPPGR
jgi:hypothetical protein